MTALTQDRDTPRRDTHLTSNPLAAGAKIYTGSIVAIDALGNATPATATSTKIRGVAQHSADNTGGTAGAQSVTTMRRQVFRFAVEVGQPITRADLGSPAYVVDDQTVSKVNGAARPTAGTIVDVDSAGVWVDFV